MSNIRNQYWNFGFFQKHKKYFYFHNFGQMWLVNEYVLNFSTSIEYVQAQFNLIILYRELLSIRPTTRKK